MLDSLVKNVGTPYTLYLGHNLYETFMNAYVLVDSPIRKKLDEMLKTWKEPIPGSLDTRPVFPLEKSRQIENALIKARTNALARQQTQPRPVQTPPQHYRNGPAQVAPQHRPSQAYQAQPSLGSGAYYNANTVHNFHPTYRYYLTKHSKTYPTRIRITMDKGPLNISPQLRHSIALRSLQPMPSIYTVYNVI